MKAILIDSVNREVKEVEIGKGIDEMYKFLQCDCFTIASYLDKQDAIFVDDEGLRTERMYSLHMKEHINHSQVTD